MRLLILTQYYPPEIGAPQVRLPAVAKELSALGHDVEVVTAMPNHPTGLIHPEYRNTLYRCEIVDGIPVHRVWIFAAQGAGISRLLSYASFCLTCLWGLMKAQRPDYIFVESPPLFLSVPGYLAGKFWNAKTVFNVADLWPDSVRDLGLMGNGLAYKLATGLERWTYSAYDYVTAVTEGIRTTLLEEKDVPPDKILFLPNGVDTELFAPQSSDRKRLEGLGLEGKKVFLYAGTLGYAQGLGTVVEAARQLRANREVVFVFAGDGPEKQALFGLAEEYRLENVVFIDPLPLTEIADLYAESYAGLVALRDLPLFEGARPSKILPALASGLPVVYSGAGEGARLVVESGAGVAVPPEDPTALAGAIDELLKSPCRAAEMGARGRELMQDQFSWDVLVRDWVRSIDNSPANGSSNYLEA